MLSSKNKKIRIYHILLISLIFIQGLVSFFFDDSGYKMIKIERKYYNVCKEYKESSQEEKEKLVKKYENDFIIDNDECKAITEKKHLPYSAFRAYNRMIGVTNNNILSYIIQLFIPIIIIFYTIYVITEKSKSKEIKNYLLREEYKTYKKRLFKIAYSSVLIVPIFLIVYFLIALLITKNLNPATDVNTFRIGPSIMNFYKSPLFYISYILVVILNNAMCINVSLIVMKKNKNFIVAYVESFLIIYAIYCISELVFGIKIQKLFNISSNNFNLLNLYSWNGVTSSTIYLLCSLVWFTVTFIFVLYTYKNKEDLIIACEK